MIYRYTNANITSPSTRICFHITLFFLNHIKQKDSMLSCVCLVIDDRRQNVIGKSVTLSAAPCVHSTWWRHLTVRVILRFEQHKHSQEATKEVKFLNSDSGFNQFNVLPLQAASGGRLNVSTGLLRECTRLLAKCPQICAVFWMFDNLNNDQSKNNIYKYKCV